MKTWLRAQSRYSPELRPFTDKFFFDAPYFDDSLSNLTECLTLRLLLYDNTGIYRLNQTGTIQGH